MNHSQRNKRKNQNAKLFKVIRDCPNCGEKLEGSGHFVPPCFGEKGFFICGVVDYESKVKEIWLEAKVQGVGYLTGQVNILATRNGKNNFLSDAFPKYHEGHDEECGCTVNWFKLGSAQAWKDAAEKLCNVRSAETL